MTTPEDMKDLSAVADKLLKEKLEKTAQPIPMSEYENMCNICNNAIYVTDLPTIIEVYKEVGLLILKYAAWIGLFLFCWWVLSRILDEVAMLLGY